MLRRLLRLLGLGIALALAAVVLLLAWTHWQIRRAGGPLPSVADVRALPLPGDAPVEVLAVDTATQAMPRALVLDPARDPDPDAPYRMSFPAFLLRWSDGRGLLVDLGMEPQAAREFGAALAWAGAEPIETHGSAAALIAKWIGPGPLGLIFTHLHSDHVQGVAALCAGRAPGEVALFETPAQADHGNYTTWPGARMRDEAACLHRVRLADETLAPVPGYPGVTVLHAAGHTPGSQVVIARVRDHARGRTVVFSGDVVNNADGYRHDVPKPLFYRLLVTPESDARLHALRTLLAGLDSELGAEVAVAHDRLALERLGLLAPSSASPGWPSSLRIRARDGARAAIVQSALERILATRVGAQAREILDSGSLDGPLTIAVDANGDNLTWYRVPGQTPGDTIAFDPSTLPMVETEAGPRPATPETVLAHELGHALFKLQGEDAVILEVENPVRVELGLPQRTVF